MGLVLTVFRGAITETKDGTRRMKVSKAMSTAVPAAHCKRIRVLQMLPTTSELKWVASPTSFLYCLDPVGHVLGEVPCAPMKESASCIEAELSKKTLINLKKFVGVTVPDFEVQDNPAPPRKVRKLDAAPAGELPFLTVESFRCPTSCCQNVKLFMSQLPEVFLKSNVKLLDADGRIQIHCLVTKKWKKISWQELVARTTSFFEATITGSRSVFARQVLQRLSEFNPQSTWAELVLST